MDRLCDCNVRSQTAYYLDNGQQEAYRIWINYSYGAPWMEIKQALLMMERQTDRLQHRIPD
ncbi:hypothetical protein KIL84_018051 [Mauremys mutica]|uniref:Uncharacterized protein n=1 Tax=Mauremys mutica TaxID=74926 RepID=A0A9D3XSK8_9SAUR|nr:hypothetical protein KIL84_018051 [Mauremys mutica]